MSDVEIIQTAAAVVELVPEGAAIVEVTCAAPAVAEFASAGAQGIQGIATEFAQVEW